MDHRSYSPFLIIGILSAVTDEFLIVFIDDILIYSKDEEEHGKHLKIILELLKKERLYAKFLKCDFWLDSVQFMGQMIDRSGVHVDHAKIEAIKSWAAPTKSTEVRQFLGLVRYYRRFIEGFSLISKPLTKLTQKNKKYEWGKEEEEAFQMLKQKLCSATILALPEGTKDFMVYCDASLKGYGAVLMWIELLSDYDCEIQYHPGKANVVADALSRKGREKLLRVRALMMTVHNDLPKQICEAHCVHDTFHVSNLKKCLAEPDVQVPLDEIEIDENLRFVEEPIEIVERDVKKLKRRRIPLVKVRWNSRQGAEYTWEREDQFRKKYPNLFSEPVPSSGVAT
ncbi:putative reverse transcriptase domain-containing protein [Tanacetum coccineum]